MPILLRLKRFSTEPCVCLASVVKKWTTQWCKFLEQEARENCRDCTGLCKRIVPCLKIPAPSAARQSDLPWTAQSANFGKFRLNSPNLAPFLLLNPVRKASSARNQVFNASSSGSFFSSQRRRDPDDQIETRLSIFPRHHHDIMRVC